MLTQNQIKTQIYNALNNDVALTALVANRIYWIAKPTITDTFPLVIYKIIDTSGNYAFGDKQSISEEYTVQIDVYTSSSDVLTMDSIIDRVKTVMQTQCFRLIASPGIFIADGLDNIVVRPQRWDWINV